MKKWLLLILGIVLIGILSYICFTAKSIKIKGDLVTQAQNSYKAKNMSWIDVKIKGENLAMTRTLVLTGVALSTDIKAQAETIAKDLDGVAGVDNQITIKPTPSPYIITIIKSINNRVVLDGYVPNQNTRIALVKHAKSIFGNKNIIYNLQESQGAPVAWHESIKLGLDKLKVLDYGQLTIKDNSFIIDGHIENQDKKNLLILDFIDSLHSNYIGTYNIKIPTKIFESKKDYCQDRLSDLLSRDKIEFKYNIATISPSSYNLLDRIAKIAKECLDDEIVIKGHTDSDGSDARNMILSAKRAHSVEIYLINKGIEASRLESIGYGKSRPIASNDTDEGKKKNRRIEFIIKGVEL